MKTVKKTNKQKLEEAKKEALRQRLIDLANGAGIDDVECGDYWCYDVRSLHRLIRAVSDAFTDELEENQRILDGIFSLEKYDCLDDLQEWLWGMGVRA